MKVFISGSRTIHKLDENIQNELNIYIEKGYSILVGDADGIDSLIQDYFKNKNYFNITVYYAYAKPRYIAINSNEIDADSGEKMAFKLKKIDTGTQIPALKQTKKDEAMTQDSELSLIIWDGESKGSKNNIDRAIKLNKNYKIYLNNKNIFDSKYVLGSTPVSNKKSKKDTNIEEPNLFNQGNKEK